MYEFLNFISALFLLGFFSSSSKLTINKELASIAVNFHLLLRLRQLVDLEAQFARDQWLIEPG